jgi:hypothetical protein
MMGDFDEKDRLTFVKCRYRSMRSTSATFSSAGNSGAGSDAECRQQHGVCLDGGLDVHVACLAESKYRLLCPCPPG